MTKGNLMLHCGAEHIDAGTLAQILPPEKTKTYEPVAHIEMATMVQDVMSNQCPTLDFHSWQFGVSHDGARMFGVARYKDPDVADLALAVGMRNSYDRKFSAALAMGAQVFVCDNMCFNGEVMMMQRHQTDAIATMRRQLIGYLAEHQLTHFDSFLQHQAMMKAYPVNEYLGYRMIGEALGREILTATVGQACMSEWKQATYAEFSPRNLWSLYNAGTFALKRVPIDKQFQQQKGWDAYLRGMMLDKENG